MSTNKKSYMLHPDNSMDTTLNTTDLSVSHEETSEVMSSDDDYVDKNLLKGVYVHKESVIDDNNKKFQNHLRNNVSKLNGKLKEKTLQLESVKSEYSKKVDEMQINLNKVLREYELLKVQLQVEREENKIMKKNMEAKLSYIESKQGQLQITTHEIQRIFVDSLQLTEAQYMNLKALDRELSLADFISIKLYEKSQEWNSVIDSLKLRNNCKDKELHSLKIEYDKLQDELENERRQRIELDLKLERSKKHCGEFQQQAQLKNFKIDNYDSLHKERDDLEMQLNDVLKKMSTLSITYEKVLRDKDEQFTELSSTRQSIVLLKHDKEYLTKLLNEQEGKLLAAEGKIGLLEQQISKVKQAREEIFEKYMAAREQYRSEYEEKLKKELCQMRSQMDLEIDNLRSNVKEVSEREARVIVEARDVAINERDRALMAEKEITTKYEQLLLDFRHQHLSDGSSISELNNQLKINKFELEKIQLLYKESLKSVKESQLSYEKLQRKMEILLKEYYSLQTTSDTKVGLLESKLQEKCSQLEFVERFTADLESFIKLKDVAKLKDIKESKKENIGNDTSAKRNTTERLMACVDFIRRVILMNKPGDSTHIPNHLKSEPLDCEQVHQITAELDSQISMLKKELASSNLELRTLQKENSKLVSLNEQMSHDMEKLLQQDEEMAAMRQIIEDVKKKPHASRRDLHAVASSPQAIKTKASNFN